MYLTNLLWRKFSSSLAYSGFSGEIKQPNNIEVFNDAHTHPYTGLYLNSDRNLIVASAFHDHKLEKLVERSRSIRTIESQRAAVIGHGPWNNFYHWYIDSLPRLFGLRNTTAQIELFISQALSKEEELLLYALAGKNVKICFVNNFVLVKAKEAYYLPFLSESCNAELPEAYINFYKGIVFNVFPQSPPKVLFKIFISRGGSGRRIFVNQVEVEAVMEKHGYTILRLETLTLSQQIYYFRFAERVIASHGAGLTNLLYASHCNVLEIFHSDEVLGHYKGLCKASGLPYAYKSLPGKHKDDSVLLPIEDILEWINQ